MQLRPTQPRRALATAAAVIALAAPLTSCGFDYATERDYTPASGANENDGRGMDVLSAVLVSGQEGSGTFVASLANNDSEDKTFTAMSGAEGGDIVAAEFEPVSVPGNGLVNLADPAVGIVVSGDFGAGNVVPLTFDFGNGERISLNVPVVSNDSGYWEGMDVS